MNEISEETPVLLYDGVCGFCNKTVQTIVRYDKRGTLRFAPLQSELGQSVKARHPQLEHVDSVVFVEHPGGSGDAEEVFVKSRAALRVVSYLGGFWKIFLIFRLVPRPIRDFLYDLFAKYRYRLFGKTDACMLPSPEVRERFLN
jgi:predicted DCC family thiol-disulfide oxidoreductase YuxK